MKNVNLLAASVTAATFVVLALLPLTKEALRFDAQMSAGKPVLGRAMKDMGIRQDSLPLAGIGPRLSDSRYDAAANSPEFGVRLANAMRLNGREKWAALQQLVSDFPENPAGHAALVRIACKSGGSVDVGHTEEQSALSAAPQPVQKTAYQPDRNDPVIMLRSCDAGERLDPENAYFPAMAAIAHLALNEDSAAHADLHRAAGKPRWYEYFDVEAAGSLRRATLLYGPQNSLTQTALFAGLLFPHYAGLRAMARVVTVQAMLREQAGDTAGLALRTDVARVGAKMREKSSTLIGGLVGMAIVRVATARPGGAPAIQSDTDKNTESVRQKREAQFLAYLSAHGTPADITQWQSYFDAEAPTREITRQGVYVSAFGTGTLVGSQSKLLTNLALLGAASVLSVLGCFALLQPWLGNRVGRAATVLAVAAFFVLLACGTWQALGNVRDILAFGNVLQALSGDNTQDVALANAERAALARTMYTEGTIGLAALLLPPFYLIAVALRSRKCGIPVGELLRRWTLPLAAALALVYAAHLTGYSLRERAVRAELQQVITHEGQYMANKLGKAWPTVPD